MLKIFLLTLATFSFAKTRPFSFEETHRRYLAPLDMIELYVERYPDWSQTSCDPYHGNNQSSSALKTLLGENRAATGEPDTWAPSVGLVTLLKSCLTTVMTNEQLKINQSNSLPPALEPIADLIPKWKANQDLPWSSVLLKDLPVADQEKLVRSLIRRIWGTLVIYEEFSPGQSLDQLILDIRTQLQDKPLFQVYSQVLIWASLRDEFLMF